MAAAASATTGPCLKGVFGTWLKQASMLNFMSSSSGNGVTFKAEPRMYDMFWPNKDMPTPCPYIPMHKSEQHVLSIEFEYKLRHVPVSMVLHGVAWCWNVPVRPLCLRNTGGGLEG